jgi:glycosyltransferase involved in cell wall biosynthesis
MSPVLDPCLFSIIIPVYNDDKNLSRCLDSVLLQTCANFECLLIDDGSTDGSPGICDNYSSKDERIRVFHKINEGTSQTRQFGMTNARGVYILSIDSDDYIENCFLAKAARIIKEGDYDIFFLDFIEEDLSGIKKIITQHLPASSSEIILRHVLEGKLFSCLWNIILKKDFCIHNEISFTKGINYGEDSLFIIEALLNKPKVSYLSGAYYHHTINQFSFTQKNKKQRFIERISFINRLRDLLVKYSRNDLFKYNFIPLNDKMEMLASGMFNKNEYQELFKPEITYYYLKRCGFIKYILLLSAETKLYGLSKYIAVYSRRLKVKFLSLYSKIHCLIIIQF